MLAHAKILSGKATPPSRARKMVPLERAYMLDGIDNVCHATLWSFSRLFLFETIFTSGEIMKTSTKRVRKAVLPAAGLGTRFLPATKALPKEMLPVVDKPLIQYVVEECVASGIEMIIIVTGRGKNAIEDHFDASPELERFLESKGKTEQVEMVRSISNMVNFSYTRQKEPLGLGHAVLTARELVGDEPFAVLLGDVIIPGPCPATRQIVEVYEETGIGTIAVEPVPMERTHLYGVIDAEPA